MLVLSRYAGENIFVGDDIELVMTHIERDQVRLALNAPRQIEIFRGEIYLELRKIREQRIKIPTGAQHS
jgi:carbon storage regulator